MANPSTTGPSGIGSEVLRRSFAIALNDNVHTLSAVGTDMIVTVLSIIVTNNTSSSGKNLEIYIKGDGGTNAHITRMVSSFGAYDTFVWNDRFVLTETDQLQIASTSTDFDTWVTYIEQEFA